MARGRDDAQRRPPPAATTAGVAHGLIEDCRAAGAKEVCGVARTFKRWRGQILAWHSTGRRTTPPRASTRSSRRSSGWAPASGPSPSLVSIGPRRSRAAEPSSTRSPEAALQLELSVHKTSPQSGRLWLSPPTMSPPTSLLQSRVRGHQRWARSGSQPIPRTIFAPSYRRILPLEWLSLEIK